ncbi:MAG: hypothetical protein GX621_04050 [Pirellulaceae bacterium]|nr:hypothetical protein [Pirellulaceae bacterium]
MGDEFDPYLRWLGIRADERPPNHYALLGVQLFEYDPEVLANAADRQMAHVRTFQSGKHSAESQRLLNELASAKICLLDPAKKAEYDAELRQRRREAELAAVGTVQAHSAAEIVGSRRSVAGPAATLLVVILMGFGLAALGIVAVKMTSRHDEPASPRAKHPAPPSPPPSEDPPPEEPAPPERTTRPPPPDEPINPFSTETPSPPDWRESPSKRPDRVRTVPPVAPEIVPAPVETPREPPRAEPPWTPIEPPVEEPRSTPEAKERPLPDKVARETARKAIRRQFNDQYQRANRPNELRGLALLLFQQAEQHREDDATAYVLLEEAATIGMVAGSGHTPLRRAASTIATRFDVSRDDAMVELIRHMADQPMTTLVCATIVTNTVSLAGDDIRNEQFEHARALLDIVHDLARKSKNPTIVRQVVDMKRDLDRRQEAHAAFVTAAETLAFSPDDPKANRIRGFYYCFYKNDWAMGRKHLMKGDRTRLKRLAELDEKAGQSKSEALAAGDAWWDAVQSAEAALKDAYRDRAEHWYRQALESLSGPEKRRIEQRLEMSKGRR